MTLTTMQGQLAQSRRNDLWFAAIRFRHCVGLEDGSRKLGSFCTLPVKMYNANVIQKRMGEGGICSKA